MLFFSSKKTSFGNFWLKKNRDETFFYVEDRCKFHEKFFSGDEKEAVENILISMHMIGRRAVGFGKHQKPIDNHANE